MRIKKYIPLSQSCEEQCLGLSWWANTICKQGGCRLDKEDEKINNLCENKQ